MKLEQRGGGVGSVGETKRDQAASRCGGQAVFARGGFHEFRELVDARDDLPGVEDAFSEPREKARRASLAHPSARRQQGGAGGDAIGQAHEVVLRSAGAV